VTTGADKATAVVVGASAGALEALSAILPSLPHEYPFPVFAVVHQPPDKDSILARLLGGKSRVRVREAEDKEPIEPGTVYLAPPDYHLLVERDGHLSLSSDEPVHFSRPSIDVLFESAADAYGAGLVGVVLSGANQDGARGLRAVAEAGGVALVQRPDTAFASMMPSAALEAVPSARSLTLSEIADYLIHVAEVGRHG
jgi:two-component system chemotaxis response regulator CheB